MTKVKTHYVCGQCGYESLRWMGKCPECESWNSFSEVAASPAAEAPEKKIRRAPGSGSSAQRIGEIPGEDAARRSSGIGELDRVLGGGIVEGALILVGGDPGIGKSTLLTQVAANTADAMTVLYVSGEESARQIKLRADRLRANRDSLFVLTENDLDAVLAEADRVSPGILIVDSIQTMYTPELASAPGSVSQVRECASRLMRFAKSSGCATFLVGHVTKDGAIAGPRVLEHMVDAVLYFEGDTDREYRLLRAVKNRFGSVNELGVFEMTESGMTEVKNPSELLLSGRLPDAGGSVVMCAMEGSRPMLVDVQALVSTTVFGNPRRMASGVDQGRLALLLAVLEKRAGLLLYNQDVYINIAGGMTLSEPAADLALCVAVASSLRGVAVPADWAVMGEVGLSGEIRAAQFCERRLMECARMGFANVILPKTSLRSAKIPDGIAVHAVSTLPEALSKLHLLKNGR